MAYKQSPALFQVGLKLFLYRQGQEGGIELAVLTDAESGTLDLPGGRINTGEERATLGEVVKREAEEELGTKVKFQLEGPVAAFKRIRTDGKPDIFFVGFAAKWLSGDITISHEHQNSAWIDLLLLDEKRFPAHFADGIGQFRIWLSQRN